MMSATVHHPLSWHLRDWGIQSLWARFGVGTGIRVAVVDTGLVDRPKAFRHVQRLDARAAGGQANPDDADGHGTACCGLIAGLHPAGVLGVAPGVSLLSVRVFGSAGAGTVGDILRGVERALAEQVDVLSMSVGTLSFGQDDCTRLRALLARSAGTLVIGAAGFRAPGDTSGDPLWPAVCEEVLAAAALDRAGDILPDGNIADWIDVATAGDALPTLPLSGEAPRLLGDSSAATAVASGLCALILAAGRVRHGPSFGAPELRALLSQAPRLTDPSGMEHVSRLDHRLFDLL